MKKQEYIKPETSIVTMADSLMEQWDAFGSPNRPLDSKQQFTQDDWEYNDEITEEVEEIEETLPKDYDPWKD